MTPFWASSGIGSPGPELLNHSHSVTGELRGDVGLNGVLTVCCSHCHCSRQSVMAIGQSWLADDDGYDTSTPYYHSSVYGWYNGFVWWVRFLSTLHLLHREEELRSMGKASFFFASSWRAFVPLPFLGFDHWTHPWSLVLLVARWSCSLC